MTASVDNHDLKLKKGEPYYVLTHVDGVIGLTEFIDAHIKTNPIIQDGMMSTSDKQTIINLVNSNSTNQIQINDLKNQLNGSKQIINQLTQQNNDLKSNISSLTQQINDLKNNISNLTNNVGNSNNITNANISLSEAEKARLAFIDDNKKQI